MLVQEHRRPRGGRRALPALPRRGDPDATSSGISGRDALVEAVHFVRYALDAMAATGMARRPTDARSSTSAAGWGRITRALLRYFAPEHVVGVDPLRLDGRGVPGVVRADRPSGSRRSTAGRRCRPRADSVDLILAYSVFSHLPERVATAWMAEFLRVLSRAASSSRTTQSRSFIDLCEQMRTDPAVHELRLPVVPAARPVVRGSRRRAPAVRRRRVPPRGERRRRRARRIALRRLAVRAGLRRAGWGAPARRCPLRRQAERTPAGVLRPSQDRRTGHGTASRASTWMPAPGRAHCSFSSGRWRSRGPGASDALPCRRSAECAACGAQPPRGVGAGRAQDLPRSVETFRRRILRERESD